MTTAGVLAEHGFDVGITFRGNQAGAERARTEVEARGGRAWLAHVDFHDLVAAGAEVESLIEQMGAVDVLVNNAAISDTVLFLDEGLDQLHTTINTNLAGPFICGQAVANAMVRRGDGGVIINVTSVLDRDPLAGKASYCATKAGLAMLTRVMALELARYSIRVVAVAPGHTDTPMNFGSERPDADEPPQLPVVPLARAARRREIAETIAFLASDDASYVTGTSLLVDGGMSLVSGAQQLEQVATHLHGPNYRD
jgi:NAD(P)-dependent dehydrogenase (short-subunit alcohol dehydrogenase family)